MQKFTIDHRYNHIAIGFTYNAQKFDEIFEWCYNKPEAYDCYATGFVYKTEADLLIFLLKWS